MVRNSACAHAEPRPRCPEPYTRKEILEERFTALLKKVSFPKDVLEWIVTALRESHADEKACHDEAIGRLHDEYRRLRNISKQIARFNRPPFVVVKDNSRETQADWRALLEYIKTEGMRDASVQRYKGLGEMNAGQLWETTMNAETRTLLQIRSEDAVEANDIFTTLMGEDVENRRKFIEENALDVRNLDL
jgi:DNA gyrase/topoisomerase IV subunit B